MLPKLDGLTVLHRLRASGNYANVLLLTAKDSIEDRVSGLDAGADDYLVKPFAFAELLARVRALLRRQSEVRKDVYKRQVVDCIDNNGPAGESCIILLLAFVQGMKAIRFHR